MFRTVLSFFILAGGRLIGSEIVEWDFAFNSDGSSDEAVFTSVETVLPENGTAAFSCGHFKGEFIPPGSTAGLFAQGSKEGMVVRMDPTGGGGWTLQWQTQTFSAGDVHLNDLVLTQDSGLIYVAGSYEEEVFFGPNQAVVLAQPSGPQGFVAVLDQDTGSWQSAYELGDVIPQSIAVDENDSFYITAANKLAAKFTAAGGPVWDLDPAGDTTATHHIATLARDDGEAESFVLSSIQGGGGNNDVRVSAISKDGELIWQRDTLSNGDAIAGGLGVSAQGLISFSVASEDEQVNYDGTLLDEDPSPNGALESYLVRIRPDGSFLWGTRVATGEDSGFRMTSADLAHDPFGNVHLAVNFEGPTSFEGRLRIGNSDTGILSVGDGGVPYHFLESLGSPNVQGLGIAAPRRNEQILVGTHRDRGDLVFGTISLVSVGSPRAFGAFTRNRTTQNCYLCLQPPGDPTPPDIFLRDLRAVLQGEQGATPQISTPAEIYREFNSPNLIPGPVGIDLGIVGLAAFISDQDIDLLESTGQYLIEEDILIDTSGKTSPSSYNLARLNNHAASEPYSYACPELCQPVRLYLIDTAVYDPGGSYFASNSKLTLLDPVTGGYGELIRTPSETAGIVTSEHGTNLLSLVAGPDEGVAQSTPITTKVYDIFPAIGSARASALIEALLRARSDRLAPENLFTPATILIASNSVTPIIVGDLTALEIAIDACCTAEIPIVMSAGNNGALAASYAPAQFGDRPCVLCTGGSTESGDFLTISNKGSEVKAVAPGENTIVATESSGLKTTSTFTGTSASAALAAGSFLQFQSANPWLLGSDLVTEFLSHSIHGPTISDGSHSYPQVKADPSHPGTHTGYGHWVAWFALVNTEYTDNDDGDPYTNLEEYVHGLDPTQEDRLPHVFEIESYLAPDLTMGFPVAWWLWDSSAVADTDENYLLRDGATKLRVASSLDLETFSGESVTFESAAACESQSRLTFEKDVTDASKKFFRVEVSGP